MTLTIQKLVTKAKIPRPFKAGRALVDRVALEQFRVECARQLARTGPVASGVIRIRKLQVRVTLAPVQLKPDALAAAWVAAFMRELFIALAYPSGVGPLETRHFETRAEYLAATIRDVMTGIAAQRWEYEEFGTALNLGASETALAILEKEPSEIIPTLLILETWGMLDRFLTSGNEADLERLCFMVDGGRGGRDDELAVDDLIVVGRLLCSHGGLLRCLYSPGGGSGGLPGNAALGTARLALKLFILLRHDSGGRTAAAGVSQRIYPRKILSALRALTGFLHLRESMAAARGRFKQLQLTFMDRISHFPGAGGGARGAFSQLPEGMLMPASSETQTGSIGPLEALIRAVGTEPGQPRTIGSLHRIATTVAEIRTELAELVEKFILATSTGASCGRIIATGNSASLTELARILERLQLFIGCGPDELQAAEFCHLLTAAGGGNRNEVTGQLISVFSPDVGQPAIHFWKALLAVSGAGESLSAESVEALRAAAALGGRRDLAELLKQLAPALAGRDDQACAAAFGNALTEASEASRSELTRLLEQLCTVVGSGAGWAELAKFLEGLRPVAGSADTWAELAELAGRPCTVAGSAGSGDLVNRLGYLLTVLSKAGQREMAELLEKLTPTVAGNQNRARTSDRSLISTSCAGLFFLIRILDRLKWIDRLTQSGLEAEYGSRILIHTLAGLAVAVLNRFDEQPRHLDAGLALFCGWLDEPDLTGFRHFFASEPSKKRHGILTALLEDETTRGSSESWQACFEALAARVIREFTGRIRGFGRASRSYVLKNFIALPGRICIDETRLEVLVAASPFNLVLHLSGMDCPIETVSWLGGRRVEFQLDGL